MKIRTYEDITSMELDIIKEIGSIGNGNAATALSAMLNTTIKMTIPKVSVLEFNEAIRHVGEVEEVVAAIMVELHGDIHGVMLFMLKDEFVLEIVSKVLNESEVQLWRLTEMETSLLIEVGNIMISSYINALTSLTNVEVNLSIPQMAIDMLGAILSVPMIQVANNSDRIMMVEGSFTIAGKELESQMLLFPDVESLNILMKKLGVN